MTKMSTEATRWFIVGGHQAGATESDLALMSGLPHHAVRRILINFQRTGSPSKPKSLAQQIRPSPVEEYDSDGNLLDTDDELEGEIKEEETAPRGANHARRRRNNKPSSSALVAYVLQKARKPSNSMNVQNRESWRPPTPPRDLGSPSSSPHEGASSSFLPPSPPLKGIDSSSSRTSPRWTRKEDKLLLDHALKRLHGGRWKELESKLDGRHSASACAERWNFLKGILFKAVDKAGTYGW